MQPPLRRHLYDRPIGVLAVLLAILVLGGLAIPGMRIRLFTANQYGPDQVYVSLSASGMSTREILDRITRPAEEIIRGLPAAGNVRSYTSGQGSSLGVEPAPGATARQLMTQLSQAFTSHRQRFPAGTRDASINNYSDQSQPLVTAAVDRGELSDEAFSSFLERVLIPLVQGIPGVAKADLSRQRDASAQVAFDADRLAALSMASEQVAKAISNAGRVAQSFPLPSSEGALARERHVRVLPVPMSPETLLAMRLDGRTSLADVATIEPYNPAEDGYRTLVNGRPGETLTVYANADANVYRTSHEVARMIVQECAGQGMTAHVMSNSHEAFDEIAHEILIAAGWCAGFSFIFLLLFLRRWRVAILVCTALPLSLLMAGIAMAVTGTDVSLLSLIGFLLASGMVIDNAIVIAESLLRARATTDASERRVVLHRAANAVAMAIVVSTLTTVAMFLPVMVTDSNAGRMWLMALAAPIVWSLIASLLVALVLVPMAFARLYPNGLLSAGRTAGGHGRWLIATERWYGRWLGRILLRPVAGLALTGLLLGVGLIALYVLPQPEERQFNDERTIQLRMRFNLDMDQAAATAADWSHRLDAHRERLGIVCVLGYLWRNGGDLTFYLTAVDPLGRSSDDIKNEIVHLLPPQPSMILDEHFHLAQFAAMEVDRAEKLKIAKEKAEKEKAAAGTGKDAATITSKKAESEKQEEKDDDKDDDKEVDKVQTTTLSFVLSAPDPRSVATAHKRLNEVLVAEGGLLLDKKSGSNQRERGSRSNRSGVTLSLTRAAEEQGWAAENVASQMARFTGSVPSTQMPGGWWVGFGRAKTDDLTLPRLLETVVYQPATIAPRTGPTTSSPSQADKPKRASTAASAQTSSAPSQKEPAQTVNAPLLNLVQSSTQPQEGYIQRRNGLTQKELSVTIRQSERKRILRNFPALLARAHIPDGVEVRLAEQGRDRNDGVSALWIAMAIAAVVIYLLMCILYESLLAPLTVMTTVPAGIVSVMGVFTIAGIPMDMMVVLGLFLLVGIVINHGVVLVDRLGVTVPMPRLMRPDGRASNRALLAMAAASRRRFTPVVLTSLTTIAAAVPMTFSHGRIFGAPISSLGLSLSIGLTAATAFTLIVVPIVYQWLGLTRAGTLALLRGGRPQ